MGKKGTEIVRTDVKKLLELLNTALADEWLAYYQYWMGAKVVKGPMRDAVVAELEEHAKEELEHADRFAERIIQLGGTPLLRPEEWYKATHCGYEAPEDPFVAAILKQNLEGERCAIDFYRSLLETVKDKDPITFHMVAEVLGDEVEHEEDIENMLEDIELIKKVR